MFLSLCPASLCPGGLAGLFLSCGDPLVQSSRNISTQLTRFPLVGRYHASPMLQVSHGLCGAPQANPCLATIRFSLEPR